MEEERSIHRIGFLCGHDDSDEEICYLTVSIPESIIENVCEDDNIGYYFDKFNDILCDKYGKGISDYLVENIKDLGPNYEGKVDLVLYKDEDEDDEKSDE
jgi:hypothetical protein